MATSFQQALDAAKAELAALDARRDALAALILSLGPFCEEGPVPAAREAPATPPRPSTRPSPASSADEAAVLAALTAAGGPVAPGQLAARLKWPPPRLREALRALVRQKRVTITGATLSRRVARS